MAKLRSNVDYIDDADLARARWLSKTKQEGDCLVWTASFQGNGYGHFTLYGKSTTAHRAGYRLFIGDIPEGMDVDHVCNNKRCVRLEHLRLLDHAEHAKRSVKQRVLGQLKALGLLEPKP